jgi:hypothetical protein
LSEELNTIKTDFLALKTSREQESVSATAITEDLQQSLKRQEDRAEAATREVAGLTQELARLKSQREKEVAAATTDSGNLAQTLKQQEERAAANARELAESRQNLAALKAEREQEKSAQAADKASLANALKSEQDRANASARDMTAATKEIEALRAVQMRDSTNASNEVANLQQALAREKARGEDLTGQIAKMTEEMQALQNVKAMPRMGLERAAPSGAAGAATELLNAPPPVLSTGAIAGPTEAGRPTADGAIPAPSTPVVRPTPTPSSAADDRLTARADMLFRSGDVSGARLLLERAQQGGNAQAIFLLAETFDPNALATIGAVGIRSDPARARELYGRALALGIARAGTRMEALK